MAEWSRGHAHSLSLQAAAERFEDSSQVSKNKPFPVIANAATPVQIPEETEGYVVSLHMLQATTAYRMCPEYLDFPST